MTTPSSSVQHRSDVCIVGNGAIAKTAALGFAQAGHSVSLLVPPARPAPAAAGGEQPWDVRVYALNHTAQKLLSSLKVWGALDLARVAPVDSMSVNGDGKNAGGLMFDAFGAHVGTLAWIVEDSNLNQALDAALKFAHNVHLVSGCAAKLECGADAATVWLEDGRTVACDLVVGADGRESWVRGQCGIGIDYARTTSAPSSPILPAKSRTTVWPTSGSPVPTGSSRCCRCRATASRWCGRRPKRWPGY
jgi:2-polyprenyl-6-methoxyphenol hydroxylase-like FAD-dependent oxidoreductase